MSDPDPVRSLLDRATEELRNYPSAMPVTIQDLRNLLAALSDDEERQTGRPPLRCDCITGPHGGHTCERCR